MSHTANQNQDISVVSYDRLFEQFTDPCVVFDMSSGDPIIIESNTEFKNVFAKGQQELYGEPLNDLIVPEENQAEAHELDERTIRGEANEEIIKRKTVTGISTFLYRGIPLGNMRGFGMYIDIDAQLRQHQYIDVFQRLFRHNLRNELNIIAGNINHIRSEIDDEELDSHCLAVKESVSTLNRLTNEVSVLRDLIKSEDEGNRIKQYELQPIVERAASSVESNFELGEVTVSCPDDLSGFCGSKFVEAIKALVDNGLRHNESDTPHVMIRCVDYPSDSVGVVISDNGVGIPITEKKVINGETDISPLEHGSGLGLWIAKWIIESYNGQIQISNPKTNKVGTVVYIRLFT